MGVEGFGKAWQESLGPEAFGWARNGVQRTGRIGWVRKRTARRGEHWIGRNAKDGHGKDRTGD